MKGKLIIAALLLPALLSAEGLRKEAGDTFLEPLQKRDSVLVADQLRYGVVLKDVPEGTPLALPEFKMEEDSPLEILGGWQLDSVRVSKRKEVPARYDITAALTLTAFFGGTYDLPPVPVLMDGDTLVFRPSRLEVTEPSVDMENFTPHDIKDQIRFPYTLAEIFPWLCGLWAAALLITAAVCLLKLRRKKEGGPQYQEPAHITALRKLDRYRGEKFWEPAQQKAFYSGVTDALREYIAARYGVGALEMTTAEIFRDLKGSDLPEDLYAPLKELFERADFVKFAKYVATAEDNASVLPLSVRFVTSTYQTEIDQEAAEGGEK